MFSKRYFGKICTAINHLIFVADEKKNAGSLGRNHSTRRTRNSMNDPEIVC